MGNLAQNAMALATAAAALSGSPREDTLLRIDCGSQFCKATTQIEGGQRVLYMEASSQARDLQNERILADALIESKDYFLRYGRLDLDHATVYQAIRDKKLDPENPYSREIGKPTDVRVTKDSNGPRIWVRGEIFQSKDPKNQVTPAADWFWDTLQVTPPMAWYPSVSGHLLNARHTTDKDGARVREINKLRWHSIGLSRNPVNTDLGPVSVVPLEVFAKALRGNVEISSALAAMGDASSPPPVDPDLALRMAGIKVPACEIGSSAPASLTPERFCLIEESIKNSVPPYELGDWFNELKTAGISPQEGLAVLVAILDSSLRNNAGGR